MTSPIKFSEISYKDIYDMGQTFYTKDISKIVVIVDKSDIEYMYNPWIYVISILKLQLI